ncbi:TadE/TadG family type IV pilus assembly protein [Aestuariimicrobium kwangyangense]|uniref:TadE/TadG family type IV pilus assembly protein n=1 Tax=Aestuariimicrobium kwangyangense TaxID=396389 RepID=UPI0003B65394|nr:TadE/TadG family type IV pilus assembly protein [Aestuariimicrobium kwangyangense]
MKGRKGQRGAAAVEFALVLPVLLVLLLGIIEYGYQFFLYGSAAGAAREGARAMAISTKSADAVTKADLAFTNTTGKIGSIAVSPGGTCTAGNPVVVTVTYNYSGLTGFFGSKHVTGKGEMRCGG